MQMDNGLAAWATFGANIVLVAVTIGYVVLTAKLSKSSKDSAESAALAARFAQESAAAANAGTQVTFDLRAFGISWDDDVLVDDPDDPDCLEERTEKIRSKYTVELVCRAATVNIHEVTIIAAWGSESPDTGGAIGRWPALLEPGEDTSLPTHLHADEAIWLEFLDTKKPCEKIPILKVEVKYSFPGSSETRTRRVAMDDLEMPGWREGTERMPRVFD